MTLEHHFCVCIVTSMDMIIKIIINLVPRLLQIHHSWFETSCLWDKSSWMMVKEIPNSHSFLPPLSSLTFAISSSLSPLSFAISSSLLPPPSPLLPFLPPLSSLLPHSSFPLFPHSLPLLPSLLPPYFQCHLIH